jgi:hypothetical protein
VTVSDPFAEAAALEGVASAMAATRDAIDVLLRDRGLRRTAPEDTARALLLGAAATAGLEGGAVEPEALAEGAGDATARAALRLSTELLSLVPVWRSAPLQAIARIHALAAAGTIDDDDLGKPDDAVGATRLAAFSKQLARPTTAPALVVAALAHAEIATCGAFSSLAGVVGRAVERLVLVERGVDPASVLVPEFGHAQDPDSYRSALSAYVIGGEPGVAQWLRYASLAFARGAEASPLTAR